MIKQNVQMTLGATICDFGSGDISVGVKSRLDDSNKVSITLGAMKDKQEIGSPVQNASFKEAVVMNFDKIESLETVKKAVESAIDIMKKKAEIAKMPEDKVFTVSLKNIWTTGAFTCSNPSPIKIMTCMKHFQEKGSIDRNLVVDKNMCLTDGYVGLLVLRNENVEKAKVTAPNGISVKLDGKEVNFKSDKIALSYDMIHKEGIEDAFYLVVNNCGKRYEFPAATLCDAVEMLKSINKVFDAEYTLVGYGTMNVGLAEKMREAGMSYKFAGKPSVDYKTI